MRKITILIVLILISHINLARADDDVERRGFSLAAGGFMGMELHENKGLDGGGFFRLGRGFTDDLGALLEGSVTAIGGNSEGKSLFLDLQLMGQSYIWRNLYFVLGAGVSKITLNTRYMASTVNSFGVVMNTGAGYEFMLGDNLFFAPEFRLTYRYIGLHFVAPTLGVTLGAHF